MRGDKYFLMLTLMVFTILGTITLLGSLPGFYFAIELYVVFFLMLTTAVSIYFIREKNMWGWRLGAIFFAASIVNVLYLFTLSPQPIQIILTIVGSAGYIIALDHINHGKLVFDDFNLEQIDVGGMVAKGVTRKTLGVLDEDRTAMRDKIRKALTPKDGYVEIPVPAEVETDETEGSSNYDTIIKKRDYEYYTRQTEDMNEDRGIEEVTISALESSEPTHTGPIEDETVSESDKFIASPLSTKFHVPGCRWIQRLDKKDAAWFSSTDEAVKAGYSPCTCVSKDTFNL